MSEKYDVLISYDVDKKQTEIKQAFIESGYMDSFKYRENNQEQFYLPETTLWKSNFTSGDALNEATRICREFSVTLERFVVTRFDLEKAIPGKPYKN